MQAKDEELTLCIGGIACPHYLLFECVCDCKQASPAVMAALYQNRLIALQFFEKLIVMHFTKNFNM